MSTGVHGNGKPPRRRYRFGAFALDLDRGFLYRDGTDISLRPKAFDTLAYLVARPGKLVTKAELIAAVWPDTSVTDNSLSHCLLDIRRALGDESQQLIRTIPRRGYVFAAPVAVQQEALPESGPSAPVLRPPPREAERSVSLNGLGWRAASVFAVLAIASSGLMFVGPAAPKGPTVTYTQLTHLTDAATSPALSPDGRMVAFIRGANTFLDTGQVYVRLLPDGEAVQLTRDDRPKMAPAFSPDGSRIAYTLVTESGGWETWTVPVLGGEPQLMMTNAAALSWVRDDQVLFSQIVRGMHMTVVTSTAARANVRTVYAPPRDGMAHRAAASPDGRWVLVSSEMNASGWLPCRLVPMDGSDLGRSVGPPGAQCTHAAWSPDGQWMYFSAATQAGFRTWRQEFPDGVPAQLTFGAAEEEGLAVWPDGRSLVSSVGATVSAVWVHDAGIERQITSEGFAHLPSFSRDGRTLYYLQRVSDRQHWAAGELWAVELASGTRRRLLPGISMAQYELSADGTRVVLARTDPDQEGVWIAPLDGRQPPTRISVQADTRALWGPDDDVIFEERQPEGKHLIRARPSGERVRITKGPIINLESVSPDRRWALVWPAADDRDRMLAYPLDGGHSVQICERCNDGDGGPERGRTPPSLMWSPDGEVMYARFEWSPSNPALDTGRTYAVSLARANGFPPPFAGEADLATKPGVRVIPRWGIFPGPSPTLYAYTQAVTHRNLYRIALY